jgi:GAF domain-containing protein
MGGLDDPARLAALERLDLLEGKPDAGFDRYTALAADMLDAPLALVSLVQSHRQVFLSRKVVDEKWAGIDAETPLSYSFCKHAVVKRAPLVIEDARVHPLVDDNPAVDELDIVAYAGAPIVTADDQALGTLCVVDDKPRQWTSQQVDTLADLAAAVGTEIELRAKMRH